MPYITPWYLLTTTNNHNYLNPTTKGAWTFDDSGATVFDLWHDSSVGGTSSASGTHAQAAAFTDCLARFVSPPLAVTHVPTENIDATFSALVNSTTNTSGEMAVVMWCSTGKSNTVRFFVGNSSTPLQPGILLTTVETSYTTGGVAGPPQVIQDGDCWVLEIGWAKNGTASGSRTGTAFWGNALGATGGTVSPFNPQHPWWASGPTRRLVVFTTRPRRQDVFAAAVVPPAFPFAALRGKTPPGARPPRGRSPLVIPGQPTPHPGAPSTRRPSGLWTPPRRHRIIRPPTLVPTPPRRAAIPAARTFRRRPVEVIPAAALAPATQRRPAPVGVRSSRRRPVEVVTSPTLAPPFIPSRAQARALRGLRRTRGSTLVVYAPATPITENFPEIIFVHGRPAYHVSGLWYELM